jgi:hypothetical protein
MSDVRNRNFDIKPAKNGYLITVSEERPTIYAGGYETSTKLYVCKDWDEVMVTLKKIVEG